MTNLFVDDIRFPSDVYGASDDRVWRIARTYSEALECVKSESIYDMSVDHDLGLLSDGKLSPTGYDLLCYMEENDIRPNGRIVVHSANPVGAQRMRVVADRVQRRKG